MKRVVFEASFGDQKKLVELAAPSGGGNGYQIFIDKYYQGMLVKTKNKWTGQLNPSSHLSAEDIIILGEIIDNQLA